MADIGAQEVLAYIARRLDQGRKPGCINRELSLMSGAMRWAKDELEWDVGNPWRSRSLSQEEVVDLLAAAEEPSSKAQHLGDLIRLILATGLRIGDGFGLEWRRVDLSRNLIRFEAGDQKNCKAGTIPVNPSARAALLGRARFRATHCPDAPWVCCNQVGARFREISTGFLAACKRAGIEDCLPHDLRRTCGSWLVRSGVSIDRVSRLLRHGDVGVTVRVYAHQRPQDLVQAAIALDGYKLSRSVSRSAPEDKSRPGKETIGR